MFLHRCGDYPKKAPIKKGLEAYASQTLDLAVDPAGIEPATL